jgi:hypothetical protein
LAEYANGQTGQDTSTLRDSPPSTNPSHPPSRRQQRSIEPSGCPVATGEIWLRRWWSGVSLARWWTERRRRGRRILAQLSW